MYLHTHTCSKVVRVHLDVQLTYLERFPPGEIESMRYFNEEDKVNKHIGAQFHGAWCPGLPTAWRRLRTQPPSEGLGPEDTWPRLVA